MPQEGVGKASYANTLKPAWQAKSRPVPMTRAMEGIASPGYGLGVGSLRRGLSLLEILVALTILLIGLVPLVDAFKTGFRGAALTGEHAQAMLIAESVMEEARARVTYSLTRYYGLADTGSEVLKRARRGDWKNDFLRLETPGPEPIVSTDRSKISTYFRTVFNDGTGEGPISGAIDPIAVRQLEKFRVAVKVSFGQSSEGIDSNGDRRPESDMCEIEVIVTWDEPGRPAPEPVRLKSLFTREEYDRALEAVP